MNAIFERRSVRKYTEQKIEKDKIVTILKAGMQAPSAHNQQPWEFLIVEDKNILNKITEVHPYSKMLPGASHVIVVCSRTLGLTSPEFTVQDCAAATQNMLVMAKELGIGSVWLGVSPKQELINPIKDILNLPQGIIPFSMISLGYPTEDKKATDRFEEQRIHWGKW